MGPSLEEKHCMPYESVQKKAYPTPFANRTFSYEPAQLWILIRPYQNTKVFRWVRVHIYSDCSGFALKTDNIMGYVARKWTFSHV